MRCKLSGKTELKRLESKSIPDVPEMEGVVGLEADIIPASTQFRQKQETWQKEVQAKASSHRGKKTERKGGKSKGESCILENAHAQMYAHSFDLSSKV